MVIKNKDGSEYKLRFPNPLMKAQDLWEPFEVHNMNFEELMIETKNVENKNKSNKLNIGKTSVFEKNKEPDIININEKSNQLANYLHKLGVKAETLVTVASERSIEMLISILGILKAGGVYVPLDPSYPDDRLRYM